MCFIHFVFNVFVLFSFFFAEFVKWFNTPSSLQAVGGGFNRSAHTAGPGNEWQVDCWLVNIG